MRSYENCIITPHNSWATSKNKMYLLEVGVKNLENYYSGITSNIIN